MPPPPPRANSWETRLRAIHLARYAKSPLMAGFLRGAEDEIRTRATGKGTTPLAGELYFCLSTQNIGYNSVYIHMILWFENVLRLSIVYKLSILAAKKLFYRQKRLFNFRNCLGGEYVVGGRIVLRSRLIGRVTHHAVGGIKIDVEAFAGVRVCVA